MRLLHRLELGVTWLSVAMFAGGFIGLAVLNFLDGPDTGAPYSLFAGITYLRWVLTTPAARWCAAAQLFGIVGLLLGMVLPKKSKKS